MAVLIFNIRREPTLAAKEENDIKIHRGDLEQIKTYKNTIHGKLYYDEFERKVGASSLMERAAKSTYKRGISPKEVLVLVCGFGVQTRRTEAI